jgi:hypothetical protein
MPAKEKFCMSGTPVATPDTQRAESRRRILLALAQVGVILLGVVVLAAAALLVMLAQFSHDRDEAMMWTVGTAVVAVAAIAGLVWLFIWLNRKRKGVGVATIAGTPGPVGPVDVPSDPSIQSALQLLRIALAAILLVGLGGLALRFMGGRPPIGLLVVSLMMFGAYVAPYAWALLRIAERFDESGVSIAHAYAWASLLMSFRWLAMFMRYTVEFRQVLVVSALNLLLDALVIYCCIRLWRAVRKDIFVVFLVGALIYRVVLDFVAPMFYSRIRF